jgi:dGTPase
VTSIDPAQASTFIPPDGEVALAPYAMRSERTRGRAHPIAPDRFRTEFQRDRDRIIHCAAFRKLEYKTQVYVIHEGDYYRTRLTHTLEVAQIGRTLARALGLNPDLTEAIALSHDLGHTPFGHSGEAALAKLLPGGFEHNRQSLRVVEVLEERHHEHPGLNLTWEVREGIAKHATQYDSPDGAGFDPESPPTLEAQICDLADEIAYNHHDIDDAMKMGLIEEDQLRSVEWVWAIWSEQRKRMPEGVRAKFVKFRAIGGMMDATIGDAIESTQRAIASRGIDSPEAVRKAGGRLADFSPAMKERLAELRAFLLENVYLHPHVARMQSKAEGFVRRLFEWYRSNPKLLPIKYHARIERDGAERAIADYISGMTDSFCMAEYRRAFEPSVW